MQLRFLLRSLWYYRKSHLGVVAGTMVGAMVLLGALLAGDSVGAALKRLAELRVGKTEYVLTVGDRFVGESLAESIELNLGMESAPILMLRGSASRSEMSLLAPQMQVMGVDERYWKFAPTPTNPPNFDARNTVAVNQRLAERLQLKEGESFVVRLEKPGLLSRDAPMSGSKDNVIGIRVTVSAVISDDQFGRFGLEANQISPFTLFAPINWVQEQIEYPGRANLILLKDSSNEKGKQDSKDVFTLVDPLLTLADYGLSLVDIPLAEATEIRSERVFLDKVMVAAIQKRIPLAEPVITYLANTLETSSRETPYSMVTAVDPEAAPFLDEALGSDEAVVTQWLADDLEAAVGDSLDISYYVVDQSSLLVEATSSYTIRSIVPHSGLVADSLWMPDFPGVAGAEDSSDWDAGMPLDLDRIRDNDEEYWDDFKGAPKAFISLASGEAQWSNRWGAYTGLRVPKSFQGSDELTEEIRAVLDPRMLGMQTVSLRDAALESANSPVDIGGLFIGMSFFLIIASLSLVGMLFSFSIQQVNRENALLSSLGISDKRIYRWRFAGALLIVVVGSLAAVPLAYGYTFGVLRFLETIWSENSVGSMFGVSRSLKTIAIGIVTNIGLAMGSIWFVLRKQSKTQASFRLQQGSEESGIGGRTMGRWSLKMGSAGLAGGLTLFGLSLLGKLPLQIGFFLVGFCLLAGGLGICAFRLNSARVIGGELLNLAKLGRLNNGRRPMRSLTVVGTLACGVFLVVSVAAFRKEKDTSGDDPKNGYGGYAYWAETSIPLSDPADYSGPDNLFGLDGDNAINPIRVGQGDDASCFNLNQTANPRLLSLDSSTLATRGAFTFHSIREGLDSSEGWNLLKEIYDDSVVPAFVDSATLQWALKRKLGDRLVYTDNGGNTFEVELIGAISDTVFQGSLILDESVFLEKYPQHEGYQLFLLDSWDSDIEKSRSRIESVLSAWGGQVEIASDRLQSFHEVENTYIAIFHVLGGLGVILGSAGLGVVVARNLSERRHEFALMDAIGIPNRVRKKVVFSELKSLICWGMGIGICAAIVSIVPSMSHLGVAAPVLNVSILVVAILINAGFWSFLGYSRNVPVLADLQRDFES